MNDNSLELKIENTPKHRFAKVKEWLWRYGPAELVGTATAYVCFFLGQEITESDIVAAYAGTMGENLGFYGTMIIKEVSADIKKTRANGRNYGFMDVLKTSGKLIPEFWLAEALDSLVVRPATMGFGSRVLGREIGVGVGKVVADISFYVPTVISYELRKCFSRSCMSNNP